MTARKTLVVAAALVTAAANVALAQKAPTKCPNPDVPIKVTIEATAADGASVFNDGLPAYEDGIAGVYNTVIHLCSGSNDATMGLITSRRSVGFAFPDPYIGDSGTSELNPAPVWAGANPFFAKPFMNVRNILWGRVNSRSTFTTRMGFSSIKGPGDKASYGLVFPGTSNDGVGTTPDGLNDPYQTVAVTVTEKSTCSGGGVDAWEVTNAPPDGPLPLGVLMKDVRDPDLQSGQYVMPFKIVIEAKSCVPLF